MPNPGPQRLTYIKAEEIRAMHKAGYSYSEIAAKYGISRANVGKVCTYETWKSPASGRGRKPYRINADVVARVRALKEAGMNYREITAETGLSRVSVGAICASQNW